MTSKRPIVIAGLPRSGTTWTTRAIGSSPGLRNIVECDNEDKHPEAIHAKRRLGRYPVLGPGDQDHSYHRLWEWILHGAYESPRSIRARRILPHGSRGRLFDGSLDVGSWLAGMIARNPRPDARPPGVVEPQRVVAKSIHLELALEWIATEFDVDVLVLLRHPANVLASWMEVNLKDSRNATLDTRSDVRSRYIDPWGAGPPGPEPLEQMCWRIGLLTAALEDALSRHPNWHFRTHERLCVDSVGEFRRLYSELDLEWSDDVEDFLREHDRPGEGFTVKRVTAEMPDSWQKRLDDHELSTLRRVLSRFPISTWSEQDFERRT